MSARAATRLLANAPNFSFRSILIVQSLSTADHDVMNTSGIICTGGWTFDTDPSIRGLKLDFTPATHVGTQHCLITALVKVHSTGG